MVSAISLCFLVIGLSAASSQLVTSEIDPTDTPLSDRRTFKHGKPPKFLPLIKKHKKFAGLVPHIFSKVPHAEIPIIHEAPKPLYKVHRYQGIEVKPVSNIPFSTPEPFIESHSTESLSNDYAPTYSIDHSFSSPVHSSNVLFLPVNDKSTFSAPEFPPPSPPIYSLPPKPVFQFIPAQPQPVFSSIPIAPISIARPAPSPIHVFPPPPPEPLFTSVPASFSPNLPPPQPIFTAIPIKFQSPVLPPLPSPSPTPILSSVPIKIQPPVPARENVFSPVSVKIPAPVLPAIPVPSPAPVFSSISAVSPTPLPVLSSLPVSLPPTQFSAIPSIAPPLSAFPPLPPALPSISATAEPEFSYPPSGTPIPSYIKDISLGDVEIKDSPLPTYETPKYEEVTPTISDDGYKNLDHALGENKNENGFFQKIKGWKADKANAALSHFTNIKQKPFFLPSISISHSPNKIPVEIPPPQAPIHPTLQFPGPVHPLPLAPAPVFFPPTQFFPHTKYENFPPNNIESPPLLNSYGVPIPHDSYAPAHVPHDRLSSAASEEEPAVALPEPTQKKEQNEIQGSQASQDFQSQFQQQTISQKHPIYVPEESKTAKEENKTIQDSQSEADDYKQPKEPNLDSAIVSQHHPNHKE